MKFFSRYFLFAVLILSSIKTLKAEIILPSVISDHMVLQQNQEVKLWGWTTNTNEELKVWGSWNNDTVTAKASMGRWMVKLKTPTYGGPYIINIKGHVLKQIQDVMIGEVWLASGQSNMQMPVDSTGADFRGVINYKEEIKNADFPKIRFFKINRNIAEYPQDELRGDWEICSPSSVKGFSAVAYFFARKLYESLDVPIGILESCWGGTNAETWIDKDLIEKDSILNANKLRRPGINGRPTKPGLAYNAMIHPIQNYHIKGVIWYQGEANIWNYQIYENLMATLVSGWRKQWALELPFYYTQIAPFNYPNSDNPPYLRDEQLKSLSIPNTGMAIINDVGDKDHIHTRDKRPVGERLAGLALSNDYNIKVENNMGPIYKEVRFKNGKAYITFTNAKGGLKIKGKSLNGPQIAGEDRKFVPAQARINGDTLVIYNKNIAKPVAVRLGFDNLGVVNLFNKDGIPASAFRTDNWAPQN